MPRPKAFIPRLCLHKGTGQAVIYLNGKQHYLGLHGTAESRRRYGEILARLTKDGMDAVAASLAPKAAAAPVATTVADLCLKFLQSDLAKYADAEQACQRGAVKILVSLFGETPVTEFGPNSLDTVRQSMINGDPDAIGPDGAIKPRKPWSRSFINKQVKRLKHLFRRGVRWEMVPHAIAAALGMLESLSSGDSTAAESRPRRSVTPERLFSNHDFGTASRLDMRWIMRM